jgi:hypothetical protein
LLRKQGMTLSLSNDQLERLFSIGFALEQLHREFIDIMRCVQEYADGAGAKSSSKGPITQRRA